MTAPNTPSAALTAHQRRALALQRIEASRTQLILTLAPTGPRRSRPPQPPKAAGSGQTPPFSTAWARRVTQDGVGQGTWQALSGAAIDWLGKQPWYASVELVGSTLAHQARPVVRRHPWVCLGAAAAAGAALVALRPWGWTPVQHRIAPWRSQVGQMVWGQLTQPPVQMALAGALAAWLSSSQASAPPSATPPSAPGTPPPPPTPPAPDPLAENTAPAAASPGVMPTTPDNTP